MLSRCQTITRGSKLLRFDVRRTAFGPTWLRQRCFCNSVVHGPLQQETWHRTFDEQPRRRRKDAVPVNDTIYALSTAPGRAAIAVIRISGPACLDIYGGLCPERSFPSPRRATLRRLLDPENHQRVLDSGALVLYFPAPRTVTGEDVLELHIHGGPAIVRAVLEAIPRCANARPRRRASEYALIRAAEPGEFTKRAFHNDRIDLTEAEALGETLAAETEQQRRLAVSGTGNVLTDRYEGWREQLLYARGELEALIDFSEDQHFDESPVEFMRSVTSQVLALRQQILLHIQNADRGELLRHGISVALLGAPNAGKSSLLNRIVGREAAIVSTEAGTTRDIVDVNVDIGGWLVKLGDMAGLRTGHTPSDAHEPRFNHETDAATIGAVEREGIRRARARAMQADVVIVMVSVQRSHAGEFDLHIEPEVVAAVADCQAAGKTMLLVVNKSDLLPAADRRSMQVLLKHRLISALSAPASSHVFFLSCTSMEVAEIGNNVAVGSTAASASPGPDSGSFQTFLSGLTTAFMEMTSAVADVDQASMAPHLTAEEAQAYWNACLSVTHRQQAHLRQCLVHLDDYLIQYDGSSRTSAHADQPSIRPEGLQTGLRHAGRDGDDDDDVAGADGDTGADAGGGRADNRVGRKDRMDCMDCMAVIDTPRTHNNRGLTHVDGTADPGDHPPLSADVSLGGYGGSPDESDPELDVVTAAEHLRYAADDLAKITGRGSGADVDHLLGVVFEK